MMENRVISGLLYILYNQRQVWIISYQTEITLFSLTHWLKCVTIFLTYLLILLSKTTVRQGNLGHFNWNTRTSIFTSKFFQKILNFRSFYLRLNWLIMLNLLASQSCSVFWLIQWKYVNKTREFNIKIESVTLLLCDTNRTDSWGRILQTI
jgi:hypothetical protein